MSWWDDGPDVLGDGPADNLKAAWRRILAERGHAGTAKPALSDALRSYATALRSASLKPALIQLELRRDGQPTQTFTGAEDAPQDLVAPFVEALQAIVQDYERTLERPPSPNEAAKTFEFIVSVEPSTYFSEPLGREFWHGLRIRALPASASSRR